MQHYLRYHYRLGTDIQGRDLRSQMITVRAETELGPSPQLGFPESFSGNLPDATPQLVNDLRFDQDVQVGFEGKRYRFSRLEKDGTFELQKDW